MNEYIVHINEVLRHPKENNHLKAISLFCGGGGIDIGISAAGFDIIFASDLEKIHCETISNNFESCIAKESCAKDLSGNKIKKVTDIDEIDLIVGGPPCQAFSILGNRNSFDDPRGQLVFEYARLINEIQPKCFLFENVPGLQTLNKGKDWNQLLEFLREKTGYKLFTELLNAADFGVPQIRKRLFIVGFRDHAVHFKFPAPKYRAPSDLSLFNANLPEWLPAKLALESIDGLPNNRKRPHSDRVRNRYLKVEPGKRDKVDHTDRIYPDRPSGTVLVGSQAGGGRPFIHPYEPRHITVREAARLQSFPDWYVFAGPETWQYRAVGNAVPPILALEVGSQIRLAIEDSLIKSPKIANAAC